MGSRTPPPGEVQNLISIPSVPKHPAQPTLGGPQVEQGFPSHCNSSECSFGRLDPDHYSSCADSYTRALLLARRNNHCRELRRICCVICQGNALRSRSRNSHYSDRQSRRDKPGGHALACRAQPDITQKCNQPKISREQGWSHASTERLPNKTSTVLNNDRLTPGRRLTGLVLAQVIGYIGRPQRKIGNLCGD